VYARSNPLLIIDPTGLDIEVLGTEQNNYLKRLQSILSFTVQLNKQSNKIEIVDSKGNTLDAKVQKDLGKTLKGGERQLFEAITDPKHHVAPEKPRRASWLGCCGKRSKVKGISVSAQQPLIRQKPSVGRGSEMVTRLPVMV
jgi:uncharacterized protein YnzC (UPF0291/DUF896 family)